jgi:hypothetical protein
VRIVEPADGAKVKKNFQLRVDARDDCNLTRVQVQVAPQSLRAESFAPPFEWDLTNISGQQTITITAVDGFGHVTTKSVTVTAPMSSGTLNSTTGAAGCAVASSAFGVAGALPALGVLLLFSRRRPQRRRRRAVTGALQAKRGA